MRARAAGVCAALALVLPTTSEAAGGDYVISGGTRAQRAAVVSALEASSFDWSLVPGPVAITIARGSDSRALPGRIWLDADLLDAGRFAWGVVQHEYAHQVDFLLLDDAERAFLFRELGGSEWCSTSPQRPNAYYGCERFASTLAWSYWPSRENCMKPETPSLAPARFRALLGALLRGPARAHLRSRSDRSRSHERRV
jgi:hypothetical protein